MEEGIEDARVGPAQGHASQRTRVGMQNKDKEEEEVPRATTRPAARALARAAHLGLRAQAEAHPDRRVAVATVARLREPGEDIEIEVDEGTSIRAGTRMAFSP
jgi:hypothetical protein